MELENEKNQDQLHEEHTSNRENNDYRPAGRSPRPRIHANTRPANNNSNERQAGSSSYERPAYGHRPYNNNDDEGGFRPEGFGASLQSSPQQRPYRPRANNYNNAGGYGQPRQQGGYQPRPRFNQNADGQQGGYQPRPRFSQNADGQQGGYQPRPRFNQNADGQQGGYQPRPRYGQSRPQQGGYGQQRPQQGGYGQQRPYGNHNGQFTRGGGYGQKPRRPHTSEYDPNAKYSMKKRIEYKEQNYDPNEPVRLNKFLANAGVCSRREADEFIQAGVVSVNGQVVTELGTKVLRTDEVRFHDQPVSIEKKVYVLLNKPKDYVTTSDDPQQRKTVMDLVKNACPERIYPVGRLDRNTTGVLLLTNDGDLASKLTHPKYLKKKIYHVYLDRNVTAHDMQQIAEGINLDDGEIKADDVQYASPTDKKQVGIEIHSGKNRIVRRIFESLGYKVTKLDRVQFAGLTKKNLRRGDWRYLTEEEVDRLRMGAYE
ncbi:MAG: RNA-binding S4 domain-containing protein [Prevotella sp.]|jgi:23S rRNA pseudouridine2605 synthase|nr:RNA-binding S4 domain-containing protein [Prevotella sp.]